VSPLGAVALEIAAGATLAWRLLGRGGLERRDRGLWALALAAPLGAGWASLLYVGLRALSLPPPSVGVFLAASVALACGLGLGGRRVESSERPPEPAAPTLALLLGAAALLAAALVALRAAGAFWSEVPHGAYDAVATWNLRARLLAGSGAGWVAALDATNYPLLLPAAIAAAWNWTGGEPLAVSHAIGGALAASCALVLPLVAGRSGRPFGLAAGALLLATPTFLVEGLSQEADVPLAALLLPAAAILASRLAGRAGPAPEAAGLLLGLAAWTKNEGVLWAGLVAAVWLVAGGAPSRRELPRLLAGAAPGLVACGLWKALAAPASGLAAGSFFEGEWSARLAVGERWRQVASALAERFDPREPGFAWGLAWAVVAAAALVALVAGAFRSRGPRGDEARFWGLLAAGWLLALLPLYVLTPLPLDWHLATSLDRLLLQLYPSALAAAAAWASAATGSGEGSVSSRI